MSRAPARTRAAGGLVLAALVVLAPREAIAQATAVRPDGPTLRPWRPVLSVAGAWTGPHDLGRVDAQTRRATVGTATPLAFTLFTTESTLGGAPSAELALTMPVTRRWAVTVRGAAARPTLTTTIASDAEGAPRVDATDQVSDYTVDVSLAYQLPRLGGRRARPYLVAGGGYLRQLHEDNVLVETGRTWHGGAGMRVWMRGGDRRTRGVGLTGEVRWAWRSGGIAFTSGARAMSAAALGVFVGF